MALTTRESDRSGEAGVNVVAWLNRLGLEQYEQAFRENDVDAEVLPELTPSITLSSVVFPQPDGPVIAT
jgi:hypothetical protein